MQVIASPVRRAGATIALGLAGAAVASELGMPAGALIGATLIVTLAAALAWPVSIPPVLRDIAFATIGVTLGAGVTPTLFDDLARFPLSLTILAVALAASMVVSGRILVARHAMTVETAALSTSPGALSYALSLAEDRGGDTRTVMLLQSLRLLAVTLALPPLLALLDPGLADTAGSARARVDWPTGGLMLALAYAFGFLGQKARVPAAYLLAGVLVSGFTHWQGWAEGPLPRAMNFAGFAIAGALVGTRFAGVTRADLRHIGVSAIIVSVVSIGLTGLFALAMARIMGLPVGQIWVAYAPGGVEAMASMALSMGYDPIFVATHHVFRLLALLVLLPIALKWLAR